ncbi:MAG: DUF480 domain-containing protein [Gemmataceae bacterium]|nr:DUF480 domain-containing protein [Gemmataceae bacterium]MDW8264791.1 DUF480 domain-containing protein [Gemmataceae bacterium]
MSAEAPPTPWPPLSLLERRVLGVLVEKAKTTPDVYPLSLNALTVGCNQKSNRDPVLSLSEDQVEQVLDELQKKALVAKITGGRVVRWRHLLYESWQVDKTELAILAELLLRGPQTEGELRGRASRMEPIADLDTLRTVLKPLAERRLIVYLTPERSRGTLLTHGFHPPAELERLRGTLGTEATGEAAGTSAAGPPVEAGGPAPWAQLRQELADLQAQVARLEADLRQLKTALGIAEPPAASA